MKNRLGPLLFASIVALSHTAAAAKISVAPFRGPQSEVAHEQLSQAVCQQTTCVETDKVDWKRAKREGISYFVTGVTARKGKRLTLRVGVWDATGAKATQSFPIDPKGRMSQISLQLAVETVINVVEASSVVATPKERVYDATPTSPPVSSMPERSPRLKEAPPSGASAPAPLARSPATLPRETRRAPDRVEPSPEPETTVEVEPIPSPMRPKRYGVASFEADLLFVNRSLTYRNLSTGNLREYRFPIFPLPMISAEFQPLSLVRSDHLAGLGIHAKAGFAPYLRSRRETVTESYPTTAFFFDGGIHWRLKPVETFDIAFVPTVGVRSQSYSIGPAANGNTLDGVPSVNHLALKLGAGLEIPLFRDIFMAFAHLNAMPVFSSGEISAAPYFTQTSTFGLDVNAGLDVKLAALLHLRAAFAYTAYAMTFKIEDTDVYKANGADERYLGGTIGLRLEL